MWLEYNTLRRIASGRPAVAKVVMGGNGGLADRHPAKSSYRSLAAEVLCGAPPGDGDAVVDVWNDCPVRARVSASIGMAGAVGRRTAAAASPRWLPVAFPWPGPQCPSRARAVM